jgi:uncharacterized iron-regulated membrane protein
MLRRWHRWAAIPAGLFLFFIALTGVALHVDMILSGHAPPGSAAPSTAVPATAQKADYHFILQDLHAGYYFGWTGRITSILAGLSLLVLAVTGLQIWWRMRRTGQRNLYWN